jgi:hypothetical protein
MLCSLSPLLLCLKFKWLTRKLVSVEVVGMVHNVNAIKQIKALTGIFI